LLSNAGALLPRFLKKKKQKKKKEEEEERRKRRVSTIGYPEEQRLFLKTSSIFIQNGINICTE